jgi:hypothetical protein
MICLQSHIACLPGVWCLGSLERQLEKPASALLVHAEPQHLHTAAHRLQDARRTLRHTTCTEGAPVGANCTRHADCSKVVHAKSGGIMRSLSMLTEDSNLPAPISCSMRLKHLLTASITAAWSVWLFSTSNSPSKTTLPADTRVCSGSLHTQQSQQLVDYDGHTPTT